MGDSISDSDSEIIAGLDRDNINEYAIRAEPLCQLLAQTARRVACIVAPVADKYVRVLQGPGALHGVSSTPCDSGHDVTLFFQMHLALPSSRAQLPNSPCRNVAHDVERGNEDH